jgi:hypothetical protein
MNELKDFTDNERIEGVKESKNPLVEFQQRDLELWVNAVGEPPEDRRREAATEAAGVGSDSTRGGRRPADIRRWCVVGPKIYVISAQNYTFGPVFALFLILKPWNTD